MPHSISQPPALEGRTLLDELNHRIKKEVALAAAACAFGGSYASSDDGCYYPSTYRRLKRTVL